MKQKIIALFTCFNRKEITKRAIHQLLKEETKNIELTILIVDDNSTDGTKEMVQKLDNDKIILLETNGDCYYTGGMIKGMKYILRNNLKADYLMILNDDVDFKKGFIKKMIDFQSLKKNSVIVGPTSNDEGNLTYGGIRYLNNRSAEYEYIGPDDTNKCDTFNANCVLIPFDCFFKIGPMDDKFIHGFGDFDYGFSCKKKNYNIYVLNEFVGKCNRNIIGKSWTDNSLSRKERIRLLNHPKANPTKQTFYYFNKNFNFYLALKCAYVPYIKILLKK